MIESQCAGIKHLRREVKRFHEAAKAFQELNVCYRIGKQPSESLFTRLEKARKALESKESPDA